ncbi:MAG: hypothetical protein WBW92_05460 [Rhodanobacteraceae bacterium]
MNCKHCLDLIDSHPLAELAPGQLAAIRSHAGTCPRCHQALATARRMDEQLAELPDPVLPDGLEASIMQRVLDREGDQPLVTKQQLALQSNGQRRPLGSLLLGGAMAVVTECFAVFGGRTPFESSEAVFQPGMHPLATMPHGDLSLLVLAISLLLVLTGLTGSLKTGKRQVEGPTLNSSRVP